MVGSCQTPSSLNDATRRDARRGLYITELQNVCLPVINGVSPYFLLPRTLLSPSLSLSTPRPLLARPPFSSFGPSAPPRIPRCTHFPACAYIVPTTTTTTTWAKISRAYLYLGCFFSRARPFKASNFKELNLTVLSRITGGGFHYFSIRTTLLAAIYDRYLAFLFVLKLIFR